MKICMVNDVCHMGEALSKCLPHDVTHITRSRGLFSKTLGLTTRILFSSADLYHIFYVLEDAYLALKMRKKPIVGHACGSDVRDTLHSKWGWMVRYNLKNLDYILCSQPTIVPQVREYTDRVEYFPIPIDREFFAPTPLREHGKELKVLYTSPVDFRVKGTNKVMQAVSRVKAPVVFMMIEYGRDLERAYELSRKLDLKVTWLPRQPHNAMASYYGAADVVLGNFGVGQLDTTVIEAMACGRPVVHHLAPGFFPEVPLKTYDTIEEFSDDIQLFLSDRKRAEQQLQRQLNYVKIHYADHAANRLMEVYDQVRAS